MSTITNNPLPLAAYSQDDRKQQVSVAAKTEATKLNNDQMDAAKKIIETKVITQFDKSQNNGDTLKPTLRAPISSSTPASTLGQTSTPAPASSSALTGTSAPASDTEIEGKKNSLETYNELMAELIALLGEQSIDDLKARTEMYTKISVEYGSASTEVLAQIETETEAYDAALVAEEAAKQTVKDTQQQIETETSQLQSLQKAKIDLEKKIKNPLTRPKEVQKLTAQLESVNSQITQKQASLDNLQIVLGDAQQASKVAQANVIDTAKQLDESLDYLDKLNKNAVTVNTAQVQQSVKSNAGTAALLMAQMIAIMGESTEETMKANLAFSQKTQEAQQLKLASDTAEVEKQQEKSQNMQDTMGCIGKIIGAIVMVVSTVAAIFTGGASLAFAAIGIALMAADTIYQKVTGNESFIAAALKPIMEHVLMPIIQAITDAISSVLGALGVDSKIAETIASVLAVIVLIVGAVAASVAVKKLPLAKLMNAVGGVMKKMLGGMLKALTSGVKTLADDVAKMVSKLSSSITKFLNQIFGDGAKSKVSVLKEFFEDEVKTKTLGNKINLAENGLRFTQAGIDASGNIAVGTFEKKISEVMADITRIMSASEVMKLFNEGIVDEYTRSTKTMNSMLTNFADNAGEEMAVGRFILSHARA